MCLVHETYTRVIRQHFFTSSNWGRGGACAVTRCLGAWRHPPAGGTPHTTPHMPARTPRSWCCVSLPRMGSRTGVQRCHRTDARMTLPASQLLSEACVSSDRKSPLQDPTVHRLAPKYLWSSCRSFTQTSSAVAQNRRVSNKRLWKRSNHRTYHR